MTCAFCGAPLPAPESACPVCGRQSGQEPPAEIAMEYPKFCPRCHAPIGKGESPCPNCLHDVPMVQASPETYSVEGAGEQKNARQTCRQCGHTFAPPASVCPNCGAPTASAWPPAPSGQSWPAGAPESRKEVVIGFIVGCAATLLGGAIYGLGLVLAILLYVFTHPHRPRFARGVGFGILSAVALVALLLLGAFAICLISAPSGGWGR